MTTQNNTSVGQTNQHSHGHSHGPMIMMMTHAHGHHQMQLQFHYTHNGMAHSHSHGPPTLMPSHGTVQLAPATIHIRVPNLPVPPLIVSAPVPAPPLPTPDASPAVSATPGATPRDTPISTPLPSPPPKEEMKQLDVPKLTLEKATVTSIQLKWPVQMHASKYVVEGLLARRLGESIGDESDATVVYEGSEPTATLDNLLPNRSYSFRIRAIGGRYESSRVGEQQEKKIQKKTSSYSMTSSSTAATVPESIVVALDSSWSAWTTFHTLQLPIPELKCASKSKNSLKMTWSANTAASGFALVYVPAEAQKSFRPSASEFRSHSERDYSDVDLGTLSTPTLIFLAPSGTGAANTSYTQKSLRPGEEYAFVLKSLGASDDGSDDSQFTPIHSFTTSPAVPNIPSGIERVSSSKDSLTLRWNPAGENGAPILDYTLQKCEATSSSTSSSTTAAKDSWQIEYTGSSLTHTVHGLSGGATYKFRLKANNMVGSSAFCAPVTFGTSSAPPSAPLPAAMDKKWSRRPRALKMVWDAPLEMNGSTMEGYVVQLSTCTTIQSFDSQPDLIVEYSSRNTSLEILNLFPGQAYFARVLANSNLGRSAPSVVTGPFQTLAEVPSVPSGLTVKDPLTTAVSSNDPIPLISPNKFTLTWNPSLPNGAPITSYAVWASKAGTSLAELTKLEGDGSLDGWIQIGTSKNASFAAAVANASGSSSSSSSSTSATPLLKHASFYSLRIIATNSIGSSTPSEILRIKTEVGPPSAPSSGVIMEKITAQTLELKWKIPSLASTLNGSELKGFAFEVQELGSTATAGATGKPGKETIRRKHHFNVPVKDVKITGTSEFSCTLPSPQLTPFTSHHIRFQIRTEAGTSSYGPLTSFHTPPPLPPAPVFEPLVEEKRKDTSVEVKWKCEYDTVKYKQPLSYNLEAKCEGTVVAPSSKISSEWKEVYKGASTSFVLGSLQPSTTYQFRVRGISVQGAGGWSDPPLVVRTRARKPAAPERLQLVTAGSHSVRVRFYPSVELLSAASNENGGAEPTYRIEYRLKDSGSSSSGNNPWIAGFEGPLNPSSDSARTGEDGSTYRQKTLKGLQPTSTYDIRVCASNEEGYGAWSDILVALTSGLPPPPPTKPTILVRKEGWSVVKAQIAASSPPVDGAEIPVVLSWAYGLYDAGSAESAAYLHDSSLPVTYVLSQRIDQGGWFPVYAGPVSSFAHTLDPKHVYSFQVTCENAHGLSKPSSKCRWAFDEWIETTDPAGAAAKRKAAEVAAAKEKERAKYAAVVESQAKKEAAAAAAAKAALEAQQQADDEADESGTAKKRNRGRKKKSVKKGAAETDADDAKEDEDEEEDDDQPLVASASKSVSVPSGPILTPLQSLKKAKEAKRRYQLFQMMILLVVFIVIAIVTIIYIKSNRGVTAASAATGLRRK